MNKYNLDPDGNVSEWNEAMFKMKRLHVLQTEINRCKMSPLKKHFISGEWNYIIWFRSVKALYSEGDAKYKASEITEIDKICNAIEVHLEKLPPHSTRERATWDNSRTQEIFDKVKWDMLKKLIELFERKVKKANDDHGLSTANKEDFDGRSILR